MRRFLTSTWSKPKHRGSGTAAKNRRVTAALLLLAALSAVALFTLPSGAFGRAMRASANLNQCGNGTMTSSGADCPAGTAADGSWQNGNLNASNSDFREGDSVPFRTVFNGLSGSNSVTIHWQATNTPAQHAYDYLTTWNRTVTSANPCDRVSGCVLGSPSSTFAIPPDPTLAGLCGFAGSQIAGVFTMWGGTITSVSAYRLSGCAPTSANTNNSITITFTANVPNPVLAWGGHIASAVDWGQGHSASAISGSPYHMALDSCSFNCGAQDRALKASGVLPEPTITTQVSSTTAVVDQTSITDSAILTGPNGTVTGSVAFFVCGPTGNVTPCVSGGTAMGSVTLSGGQATSVAFTPPNAGTYCFRVEYTPDSNAQYSPGVSSVTTNECFTAVKPIAATITVQKIVDSGSVTPDQWCFNISPNPRNETLPKCPASGTDTVQFDGLLSGNYQITETTVFGYSFVSGSGTNCVFNGSTATATVTEAFPQPTNATCIFQNAT